MNGAGILGGDDLPGQHLDLAGHLRRDLSRGGARVCRAALWRRHRAADARRVTFNPLNHIDPFGTIVLPALLLLTSGGLPVRLCQAGAGQFRPAARPAPRHGVGGAGRAGDQRAAGDRLVAAVLRRWLFPAEPGRVDRREPGPLAADQRGAVRLQLLPLPPLDGGRVAVGLLPRALAYPLARLEPYGIPILLVLLFVLPWIGARIGVNLNILAYVIGVPTAGPDPFRAGDYRAGRDERTPAGSTAAPAPSRFPLPAAGEGRGEGRRRATRAGPSNWCSTSTAMRGRSTCCCPWRASRRSISRRFRSWRSPTSISPLSPAAPAAPGDRRRLPGDGGVARLSEIAPAAAAAAARTTSRTRPNSPPRSGTG